MVLGGRPVRRERVRTGGSPAQIFTRSRHSMNSLVFSAVTGSGAGPPGKPGPFARRRARGVRDAFPVSRMPAGTLENQAACSQRTRQSSVSPPQTWTYALATSQVGSFRPDAATDKVAVESPVLAVSWRSVNAAC